MKIKIFLTSSAADYILLERSQEQGTQEKAWSEQAGSNQEDASQIGG